MNNSCIEIPYRIESVEDIRRAMNNNLLNMSLDYRYLLTLARSTVLQYPPAFSQAKKKVTKDFIKIREEMIHDIAYHQVDNLSIIDHYPLIVNSIPWIHEIACHENLFQFLQLFPVKIQKHCQIEPIPDSPSEMYSAVLAMRRFLRREMLIYLKTKKTTSLSLKQLKQILVALSIFEPNNDDILHALKKDKSNGSDSALHQNAMAELLFARLPNTVRGLMTKDANSLAKKMSSKMTSFNFSSRQIINLMGYVKPHMTFEDLYKALGRIDSVAMRLSIPQESKNKFHSYIESLKRNIEHAPALYRAIFLSRELDICQKLYKPTRVLQCETTLKERIVKRYTLLNTLDFYPTKDYFDFFKGKISNDCTGNGLSEKHLLTPHFFNIRIFKGKDWLGNIYMLDFCQEHGTLIIDRIQIPRELNVFYHQFFDYLRDVLIEMFEDVPYKVILMPIAISNHATIQQIFNGHKKKLSKKVKLLDSPYATYFESLKGKKNTYYMLHERTDVTLP